MAMQIPTRPEAYGLGPAPYSLTPDGGMRFDFHAGKFGLGADQGWNAHAFLASGRVMELLYRASFFRCTQHDARAYDHNGAMIQAGRNYVRARTVHSGMQHPQQYIPQHLRRPAAPSRLLRTIVRRYTALLFGKGRWPTFNVVGDPKSQDFVDALQKAEKLHKVMTRARNRGGSTGSVGLSWAFVNGKPRVLSHHASTIHIHSWLDRDLCLPEHVSEVYTFDGQGFDEKGKPCVTKFWFRRDWTPEADIMFRTEQVLDRPPLWIVDEENTVSHGDGFPHFVWVQNQEPDDDSAIDGLPDYEGEDESALALDSLNSVIMGGALKNLDPTLVVNVDRNKQNGPLYKGSEHAIFTGGGEAKYLELGGSSITAGISLADHKRKDILEGTQCVIPDPDELTAAGISRVAIEELFSQMITQADVYRTQYGDAMELLLEQQVASYRRTVDSTRRTFTEAGEELLVENFVVENDQEVPVEIVHQLDLPDRVVETEDVDEAGEPCTVITFEPRELGEGGDITLEWPPYFELSETEKSAKASALLVANGGKPVLSQQTAVEQYVVGTNIKADDEWRRIQKEAAAAAQGTELMFPGGGGSTGTTPEPAPAPDSAEASKTAAEAELAQAEAGAKAVDQLPVNRAQIAVAITVDELRKMLGLSPDSDPRVGALKLVQYQAELAALGAGLGQAQAREQAGDMASSGVEGEGEAAAEPKDAPGGPPGASAGIPLGKP